MSNAHTASRKPLCASIGPTPSTTRPRRPSRCPARFAAQFDARTSPDDSLRRDAKSLIAERLRRAEGDNARHAARANSDPLPNPSPAARRAPSR